MLTINMDVYELDKTDALLYNLISYRDKMMDGLNRTGYVAHCASRSGP